MTSTDNVREAEVALKRLGYSRVPPAHRTAAEGPAFWVQEAGVPRRMFPVFVETETPVPRAKFDNWMTVPTTPPAASRRAIVVVADDRVAEKTWAEWRKRGDRDPELSILVVPPADGPSGGAHWHARLVDRAELLQLATGVVVGLFRRSQLTEGTGQIDFEEMIQALRGRFGVDVHASLGVTTDADALFLLYQLAQRDAYAPGDIATNLHTLVLRPTGPAARLPWFSG
ncbi:MAG: hypothetical protein WCA77_01000 [Thermoplasmata archaeon]